VTSVNDLRASPAAFNAAAWGLAILRITIGLVFLFHGCQKLFTYGIGNVTIMMTHLGIVVPAVAAYVVTFVEFIGGIFLLVGFLTPLAALLLAIEMAVVILKIKIKVGLVLFLPKGFEYELTLFAALLALALAGPGAMSLDRVLFRGRRHG
jgi:putative oxidoreductase